MGKHCHDSHDDNSYKKRCYCEKCKKKYSEWCHEHKSKGETFCKRRCYTVCEIKCKKNVTLHKKWGYKKLYEGKWECHHEKKCPKGCKCDKHDKHDHSCSNSCSKSYSKSCNSCSSSSSSYSCSDSYSCSRSC
jgi:hypothetical protein